jgi:Plasmid pRiA4b ORF-3-like protein
VPDSYTLEELHGVVQVAMGWQSLHLYQFVIRAVPYGSFELCLSSPERTLAGFRFRKGAKFSYIYDMGDYWRHEIRVEDGIVPIPEKVYPICLDGAHPCPPEESGGPAGYENRRLDAFGPEAMEDLETLTDLVQNVVLDGKAGVLDDPDMRWRLEAALDRMKAHRPYLTDTFSRREVNARFRKGEHRDLMYQQFF